MMETNEPRDKFNDRTGRTEIYKLRDLELTPMVDANTGLVHEKMTEMRMCPLCGEHPREARTLWVKEGLIYNKCECGMVYISPAIKESEMDKYYGQAPSAKKWLDVLQAQEDLDEAKFDYLLDQVSRYIHLIDEPKPKLLDVGASYGFFLNLATSYRWGFEGYGLELSEDALKIYMERYEGKFLMSKMKLDEWLAATGVEERYDVVTMWEVLEHVPDPHALLEQAKKAIKPGGLLAVLVPNLEAETNRILHEKSRAFGANHLNYWNMITLRKQLSKAGFGTAYEGTIIGDVNTFWNHLNYEDPYSGSLVHPEHKEATEATLRRGAGYKLFSISFARR